MDNAGNCNTMVDHLEYLIPGFRGADSRTRCFPHTVNLIAKVSAAPDLILNTSRPVSTRRRLFHFSTDNAQSPRPLNLENRQNVAAKGSNPYQTNPLRVVWVIGMSLRRLNRQPRSLRCARCWKIQTRMLSQSTQTRPRTIKRPFRTCELRL